MNDRIELPPAVPGKLYVGGAPRSAADLPAGTDLLVLSAVEWQPESTMFGGAEVLRIPMADVEQPLSPDAYARLLSVSSLVAAALRSGQTVISTCMAGMNRSQLVAGMAMRMLGIGGFATVNALRAARGPMSLSNETFAGIVHGAGRRP